jgi:hypothetical protein
VGAEHIERWARHAGVDAVVSTALGPRFNGDDGQPPATAEEAIRYVEELGDDARAKALEYIWRAPAQIQTATRAAIEEAFSIERDGEGESRAS